MVDVYSDRALEPPGRPVARALRPSPRFAGRSARRHGLLRGPRPPDRHSRGHVRLRGPSRAPHHDTRCRAGAAALGDAAGPGRLSGPGEPGRLRRQCRKGAARHSATRGAQRRRGDHGSGDSERGRTRDAGRRTATRRVGGVAGPRTGVRLHREEGSGSGAGPGRDAVRGHLPPCPPLRATPIRPRR